MFRWWDRFWQSAFDDDGSSGSLTVMVLALIAGGALVVLSMVLLYLAFDRIGSVLQ